MLRTLRIVWLPFVILLVCRVDLGMVTANYVSDAEWAAYKLRFGKDYTNTDVTEAVARYYYAYNKNVINTHNNYFKQGKRTFTLAENQFTDMRLIQFNALFAAPTNPGVSKASPPPVTQPAPAQFNPVTDLGLNSTVADQGNRCNGGWAYASAKAIEMMHGYQMGNLRPPLLSAQNLIDCAGQSKGCKNQVPQAEFDYMSQFGQPLHLESDYKNNNTQAEQGMCVPRGTVVSTLTKYARIADGRDDLLMSYVASEYPVVIEFNPTSFEFMHYAAGVFQQPATSVGSHYLVVVGYDRDPVTNLDYWLVQNSFGTTWGEKGFTRIARAINKPLTKNAIFPFE